jgi:hypothetical protein
MVKRLFLVGFLVFQLATASSQIAAGPDTDNRKTSTPYTGDLSIFDSPGREERLQIDRVMNILGIASGKLSPTSVQDRDGLRFEQRDESAIAEWFMR